MIDLLLALSLAAPPPSLPTRGETATCASSVVTAHARTLSPLEPSVEARIVFVSFADSPDTTLPVWADSMASELSQFFLEQSRGLHLLHVEVLRRADAPEAKWRAPLPATAYASASAPNWWDANAQVLRSIASVQPSAWDGVQQVWVIHDQCAFACSTPDSPGDCEDTCPWGGIATMGVDGAGVPGLRAEGTTQRFLTRLPSARQHQVQLSFAAHEYGHRLGAPHSPGSDASGAAYVNFGRYDLMRSGQFGADAREEGLVSFHPRLLARWGWVGMQVVTASTPGVRLPALLGAHGRVVEVRPRNSTQSFLLAYHDARSRGDGRYGGAGLHVWHVRTNTAGDFERSWDLESAAGRAGGPLTRTDPLERDVRALGSAADFFTSVSSAGFSALSNPASGLYASDDDDALESVPSGIALEALRTDPATGDLLLDVYTTPVQHLLPLATPGPLEVGDSLGVRWRVRPSAEAVSVDLELLEQDGQRHALGLDQPNRGEWRGAIDRSGSGMRVRLVSRDALGVSDADTSVAFDVRASDAPGAPPLALIARSANPAREGVTWSFTLPRAGHARLTMYDLGGRPRAVLADGVLAAGEHVRAWNTREASGRRLPAGLYFARLETPDGARVRRITLAP